MNEFMNDGSDNNEKLHTLPQSTIIDELAGAEFASSYPDRPTHTGREFSSDEIGDAVKPTVIFQLDLDMITQYQDGSINARQYALICRFLFSAYRYQKCLTPQSIYIEFIISDESDSEIYDMSSWWQNQLASNAEFLLGDSDSDFEEMWRCDDALNSYSELPDYYASHDASDYCDSDTGVLHDRINGHDRILRILRIQLPLRTAKTSQVWSTIHLEHKPSPV
jgi:hypothetical protein